MSILAVRMGLPGRGRPMMHLLGLAGLPPGAGRSPWMCSVANLCSAQPGQRDGWEAGGVAGAAGAGGGLLKPRLALVPLMRLAAVHLPPGRIFDTAEVSQLAPAAWRIAALAPSVTKGRRPAGWRTSALVQSVVQSAAKGRRPAPAEESVVRAAKCVLHAAAPDLVIAARRHRPLRGGGQVLKPCRSRRAR